MLFDLLKFLRDRSVARARTEPGLVGKAPPAQPVADAASGGPNAYDRNEWGVQLQSAGASREALAAFESAIEADPDFSAGHYNRGLVLAEIREHDRALRSFERAIALGMQSADLYISKGNSLSELGRHEAALESYTRAVELAPDFAEAHLNRGAALRELNCTPAALECFERALRLKPAHEYLFGLWLFNKMAVCDWQGIEADFAKLYEMIEHGVPAAAPFTAIVTPASPQLQRRAAEDWIRMRFPPDPALSGIEARPRPRRIHLAYFSADFHEHATSHLIAELFERHDRSRFELTAFSFGADKDDGMRKRVSAAFDRFVDARQMTDLEIATRSRALGVDVALDLKGFSQDCRTGIFAMRAAPVQVNYLGYPGTMGAPYIDYLIADPVLVPEAHRQYFTEKIAYLPYTYQPNDSRRQIASRDFTRDEMGLPPHGFVFCCFNNNYKVLPDIFDCWMRILKRVDKSVLWLLEDNASAVSNLRREAAKRGVDPSRLVFAPRIAAPLHLARHRLAGLFLDTLPCNAHTTASDALWAGLPLLTCAGETFAGRVAASLLNAIGLPELVANDIEEYESIAVGLGRNPERLAQVQRALRENRHRMPLFDSTQIARHLECAYERMYERWRDGLSPAHFRVEPLAGDLPAQSG